MTKKPQNSTTALNLKSATELSAKSGASNTKKHPNFMLVNKSLKKKSSKLRNLKERADGVLGQFGDLLDVDVDVEASGEINT